MKPEKYTEAGLERLFDQIVSRPIPHTLKITELMGKVRLLIRVVLQMQTNLERSAEACRIFEANSADVVKLFEFTRKVAQGEFAVVPDMAVQRAQELLQTLPKAPVDHVKQLEEFRDGELDRLVEDVIDYLNSALAADPPAVQCLIGNRVPANDALLNHAHVVVDAIRTADAGCSLSALGLLNGLLNHLGIPNVRPRFSEHAPNIMPPIRLMSGFERQPPQETL